jgi:hypothetical protein
LEEVGQGDPLREDDRPMEILQTSKDVVQRSLSGEQQEALDRFLLGENLFVTGTRRNGENPPH